MTEGGREFALLDWELNPDKPSVETAEVQPED